MKTTKIKPALLIDHDMVANNWLDPTSSFYTAFKRKFGREPIRHHELTRWEISHNYPEDMRDAIQRIYNDPNPGYFFDIAPMPGAIEVIGRLIEIYDVRICTTPLLPQKDHKYYKDDSAKYSEVFWRIAKEKQDWFIKYFGNDAPQVMPVTDKTWIKADILIDDNKKIGFEKKHHPVWELILFDRKYPMNKDYEGVKSDWPKMERTIASILQKKEEKFWKSFNNGSQDSCY